MVGNSISVQGVYSEKAKHTSVYLTGGQYWYDMRTGNAYKGGATYELEVSDESVPAFERAGTIIPRKDRYRRSSTQMVNDPYTLLLQLTLISERKKNFNFSLHSSSTIQASLSLNRLPFEFCFSMRFYLT
ncbi:probable glucan 1,3-alpha-glucosidase [Amaranthus tricolor]|uniref:probable glucan 1,3-alpha-glucosidase n=1 Tax=Amaranthus tricolor TaxID=29722 RepID=UPI00258D3133|nr:probable glucan 1,3-alpha-glucosidase [Amaranthus tricolor]